MRRYVAPIASPLLVGLAFAFVTRYVLDLSNTLPGLIIGCFVGGILGGLLARR